MDVVHIINNLPVGGAEQFLVQLVRAQQALGLQPRVIAIGEPNPLAAELTAPFEALRRSRLNDARVIHDLVRSLKARHTDIVHTHLFYADTFGRVAARWCGIPCISTEHSTEAGELSHLRRWGMQLTRHLAKQIVAVSPAVQVAVCKRLSLSPAVVPIISNGVDLQAFAGVPACSRQDLGVPEDVLLVGCVGRIVDSKGYDALLRALARPELSSVHVLMVGDGAERPSLEDLARDLGVQTQVTWLGLRRDVPAILAALDVFAMPSHWEGHSIALLEAMAAGCALLVSDIQELTETAGTAALTVKPGNAASIATALEQMLDGSRRHALSRDALVQAQRFSIEVAARAYQTLYNDVVGNPAARPGVS
jgi:glycosyltransferase involved in cell wall biosynthesis